MATSTLRSALNYCLERPGLTEDDSAHIKRWLVEADDPVWEKCASDTRAYAGLVPLDEDPYSVFIACALRARSVAESLKDTSPTFLRKLEHQREQQRRNDLLELATWMDKVVRQYPRCRQRWVPPGAPPDPSWLEAQRSLSWLEQEAQQLRQRAATDPKADPFWAYVRVNVSRQSGGAKRSHSRELRVFIKIMVDRMSCACGKPRHNAVAMMANIAFPDADVCADDVRSVCRPTTRSGRRQSTDALS